MLPEYIGPCAFGIKMGLVLPGSDLTRLVVEALKKPREDRLLSDGDAVCITESIVARAQNNFVTVEEIATEIRKILNLREDDRIGVVFPITSRNRFALILEGIAAAVPHGEVVVQLSYPCDEVGNPVMPFDVAEELEKECADCIELKDLGRSYPHPLTGVDYIRLYREVIAKRGAAPRIFFSNDAASIAKKKPAAVIAADVHARERTKKQIKLHLDNVITLQDIFGSERDGAWSEWGLLGSNMSAGNKLKLAPRQGNRFAREVQERIVQELGVRVEVVIYGDGAYKDPSSGIYELADPCTSFGITSGICNILRTGIKLKYLVDLHHQLGKSEEEIQEILAMEARKQRETDSLESEGTTPRRMEDVLASLADLISGSADAGTPLVLIKGILPCRR